MQDENLDKNKSLVVKRSSKLVVMSSKRNRLITRAINEALDFIPISFITDEELDGPHLKKYSDGSSYYGQFKGQAKHGFGTYTSEFRSEGTAYVLPFGRPSFHLFFNRETVFTRRNRFCLNII